MKKQLYLGIAICGAALIFCYQMFGNKESGVPSTTQQNISTRESLMKNSLDEIKTQKKRVLSKVIVRKSAMIELEDTDEVSEGYNSYVEPSPEYLAYKEKRNEAISEIFGRELINTVDFIFTSDPHDVTRTKTMESHLNEILDKDYRGSQLLKCDCGVTLCKIQLAHDNKEAQQLFNDRARIFEDFWKTSLKAGTSEVLDTGEIESTIYFSRNDNEYEVSELISDTMYQMMSLSDS